MRYLAINLFLIIFSFESFARSAPDSFADLIEGLSPAVVTILSTSKISNQSEQMLPQFPEGSPFDEFFRDYFNQDNRNMPSQRPVSGLGSGFIVDKTGVVVTNNHVIANADEITVIMNDQSQYIAELLGRDPRSDLAVLKFNPEKKDLTEVSWGNSDEARVGDWTIAIGNPLGIGTTVTAGIVSAISREITGRQYVGYIQTDASINKGNSGGPLFNINGEVIGINTAIVSPTGSSIGLGFAIPSNSAKKIISQLRDYGRTKRGYLGVEITNVTNEIAESLGLADNKGAFVSNLTESGPAKAAGIQEGDVILKFNDAEIKKMSDLPRLVAESEIGSLSKVEVWRKNKKIEIEVKLGELPEKTYSKKTNNENITKIDDLGISIVSSKNNEGVEVVKVEENINLIIGDIITEVNREKIVSVEFFLNLINNIKNTGRTSLLLKILRNNESAWVTIKYKK